ncbi:MAG: hypothetical protein GF346_04440 [Candidatus Eisenbacteria bacterium]|nr:hypothetical protein [Candidatus Latescibacterota bacterium]MBD3301676.1 hypothetical protein [Candidatus Eisenbacteria bacterium]
MAPDWIPLFPLDVALFPGGELPLHIFEPRYRAMASRCMERREPFGIVRSVEETLAEVGCEARIAHVIRLYPDGRLDVLARGRRRFRLGEVRSHEDGYIEGQVLPLDESPEESDHGIEDRVEERYRRYAAVTGEIPPEPPPRGPRWSYRVAERLRLPVADRQLLLETTGENARGIRLLSILEKRIRTAIRSERLQKTVRGNGRLHGRGTDPPAAGTGGGT